MYINIVGKFIPPAVNMSQSKVYLKVNTYNLSMKCIPHKNSFHYVWEKKANNFPLRVQGVYSSELTIVNLQPEDSGEYRCIMSNATGRIASSYSKLIVISMYNYINYMYVYTCTLDLFIYIHMYLCILYFSFPT